MALRPLAILCLLISAVTAQSAPRTPPRLVVMIVMDQLAEWTYREARPHFAQNGFLRLEREGLRYDNCAYDHAISHTACGHATLGTGLAPGEHGITGNNWHDPRGTKVYCCEDLAAKTPRGAVHGEKLSAANLRAATVAERMRAHFGADSLSVCIAWKDRSAIMLGGRTQMALWIDALGNFTTSTAWCDELPAWVRALNTPESAAARYSGRVWDLCAPASAYAGLVDDRSFESKLGGTRTFPHAIGKPRPEGAAKYEPDIGAVACSPFAFDVVLNGALGALDAMPLGKDATPDFLGVCFSAVDAAGHNFDPTSVEVRDMICALDLRLAALLQQLDERVGLDQCLIILSSDHGITPAPEVLAGLKRSGARADFCAEAAKWVNRKLIEAWGEPAAPHKRFVLTGTTGGVLLDAAAITAAGRTVDDAAQLGAAALSGLPGVALAVSAAQLRPQLAAESDPVRLRLLSALQAAEFPGRSPQIHLVLQAGFIEKGSVANHGSPHREDCAVPLMVRGAGIPRGTVDSSSVTPRLAAQIVATELALPAIASGSGQR